MTEQIKRIKEYVCVLNKDITDTFLLNFLIGETIDRALNYMSRTDVPEKLERVIAEIVNSTYRKHIDTKNNKNEDKREINSISDNGQSISFSDKVKTYMINSSDEEIFLGFTSQLKMYRKARVIGE